MMDNGFSLNQIELLNWGNFHGYQKFNLRRTNEGFDLFAPPQASAILGVNGSGKTTLIDALMITLLPFENSVKLGVTNDYETGSGGGRTIRDYVLGKYSSHQDTHTDLEGVYGRKSGVSALLLKFQHNRYPQRHLTLGRIWWYANYKVSDTQMGLLSFDPLTIQDFCPEGKLPKSPKIFKSHLKATLGEVQIFETMQSYFSALSGALGGTSREDLKLLNRAFYVKSISQIDQFIKENMLLSVDNPHLDRLLENVKNGQEIASAIDTCEKKLSSIDRILKELERLTEYQEQIKNFQQEQSQLALLPDFLELENFREQIDKDKAEIAKAQVSRPHLARQLETLELELSTARSQIAQSHAAQQIAVLENQIQHLQKESSWAETLANKWTPRIKKLKMHLPKDNEERVQFTNKLQAALKVLTKNGEVKNQEMSEQQRRCFDLEKESEQLKNEIEHLTKSGSLIPQHIYEIKERAIKELQIPAKDIRFFSELVQVKKECQKFRRPVEAVFFGVARNLLCHPKYTKKLTHWLDKTGFKSDITVKRVTEDELLNTVNAKFAEDSILSFIEILPEEEHPFTAYLQKWCEDVFAYRLVDVSEFKSQSSQLVTLEGLIKQDGKTLRKLKENFSYSLGWDTQSAIDQKTQQLVSCGLNYQEQRKVLLKLERDFAELMAEQQQVEELLSSPEDLDLICSRVSIQQQLVGLQKNLEQLQCHQPELQALKQRLTDLTLAEAQVRQKLASIDHTESELSKRIKNTEQVFPLREQSFYQAQTFLVFVNFYGSAEKVIEVLRQKNGDLKKSGKSRLQVSDELSEKMKAIESKKSTCIARTGSFLNEHQRNFSDPGLSYQLKADEPSELVSIWQEFRQQLEGTELPKARAKWKKFFDQVLIDSVKDTLNEIKIRLNEITDSIDSINQVLKLTNFEELPTEERYLQILAQSSTDDRIRRFRKSYQALESVLGPSVRLQDEGQSQAVMAVLIPFVEEFQQEISYREYVTDVRNHFQFQVRSLKRCIGPTDNGDSEDTVMETFTGARKDAKSSAQTTQLAYALLASSLAHRFRFHSPTGGENTLRLIVLDEFGGKFDNEKPREIVKLLNKMGFQAVLLSPMSKADLLAESIGQMVLVHKLSASQSKVKSFEINSLEDYQNLLKVQSQPASVQTTKATAVESTLQ